MESDRSLKRNGVDGDRRSEKRVLELEAMRERESVLQRLMSLRLSQESQWLCIVPRA